MDRAIAVKYWGRIKGVVGLGTVSMIGVSQVIGNAISATFWFYTASLIGPEKYGEIGYLISIATIAATFCMFGSGAMVTVYVAKNYNILWPSTLISIGSTITVSIALYIMIKEPTLIAYLVGYVIYNLGISDMKGRKGYKQYSILFILQKVILVVLAVPMYFVMGPTGIILGAGLSMLVFMEHIVRFLRKTSIDFSIFRMKIRFAINTFANGLVGVLNVELVYIIMAPLLGFGLLGNYHLSIQILTFMSILITTLNAYTLTQDAVGTNIMALRKMFLIISIGLSIAGILLSPILIPVIFPEFIEAVSVIQVISLVLVPRAISAMFDSKFLGNEKSGVVFASLVVFLCVHIPLIYVLGSAYSVVGVAVALLVADISKLGFFGIIYMRMIRKAEI